MQNTYQMILEQALILFNKNGVRNTSMRMIANACGISVGNVTYHFPHKQQIVEEIMKQNFSDAYKNVNVQTYEDFEKLTRLMLEMVEKHRFFIIDNDLSDWEEFSQNIHFLYDMLDESIDNLQKNHLIKISTEEKQALVSMYMLSPITWASSNRYLYGKSMSREEMCKKMMILLKTFRIDK